MQCMRLKVAQILKRSRESYEKNVKKHYETKKNSRVKAQSNKEFFYY